MTMQKISDFLREAAEEFGDELDGVSGGGGWNGPPLADDREYRVKVFRAEWYKTQGGNMRYSIAFEVVDDPGGEFVGRKFSEYYNIDSDAPPAAKRSFASFIGASGLDISELDQSNEQAFIEPFEGITFIAATRIWGEDGDKTGIRYLNRDKNQDPRAKINPPKKRGGGSNLSADISVNKNRGPQEDAREEQAEEAPEQEQPKVTLPGGTASATPNLPPGLGG